MEGGGRDVRTDIRYMLEARTNQITADVVFLNLGWRPPELTSADPLVYKDPSCLQKLKESEGTIN